MLLAGTLPTLFNWFDRSDARTILKRYRPSSNVYMRILVKAAKGSFKLLLLGLLFNLAIKNERNISSVANINSVPE